MALSEADFTSMTSTQRMDEIKLLSKSSKDQSISCQNNLSNMNEPNVIKYLEMKEKVAESYSIEKDTKCYFICNSDSTISGGKRKKLLRKSGLSQSAILTVYNSLEKSCYIVYASEDEISNISDFSMLPLSYNLKVRSGAIDRIIQNDRTAPIEINSSLFYKDDDVNEEQAALHREIILNFVRNEILNDGIMFVPTSSMDCALLASNESSNIDQEWKDQAWKDHLSICSDSYEYLQFSYRKESDLCRLNIHAEDMENFIMTNYGGTSTYLIGIPAKELFQNCLTTFIMSLSLLPEMYSIEIKPQAQLVHTSNIFGK